MNINEHYWRARNTRTGFIRERETQNRASHWAAGFLNWDEDLKENVTAQEGDAGLFSKDIPHVCKIGEQTFQYDFTDWLDKARGVGSHWYKALSPK